MPFMPLPPPFHWCPIQNIDNNEIPRLATYLGIRLDPHFRIKSNWNYYRQYDVFGIDNTPIFHIKKSVEQNVLYEAFALHLGRLADPDLCPKNYIVGTYNVGFWRWKNPIPYVLTTYVIGHTLPKNAQLNHLFQLGRQFIFHKLLELHDVEERHFIVQNNLLVRIDYDLSFRELTGKYTGFDRWIKKYRLFDYSNFLRGASYEVIRLRENLTQNRTPFLNLMAALREISTQEIGDRIIHDLYDNVVRYWEQNCADILEDFLLPLLESRIL
ncbi:MAG: hypothetical protein ACTSRS_00130 [Candidatus Helarchaeota archaeon]